MEVALGFLVIMIGTAIYDGVTKKEELPVVSDLPAKEFFDYDMDATFYEKAYSLSFKVKEDKGNILKTTNTVETTVYSPEPQFHSFGFMDPDVDRLNEFKLQFQFEPLDNELEVDLSYMIKISQNIGDKKSFYTKEVNVNDETTVDLYNPTTKQYEEVFLEIDIYNIKKNQYYNNPSSINCHTDYCEVLKKNTKNLLN
jgi:hypothetical protein